MTTHIYRRVSTAGQAGEDKSSPEDQLRRCRGAAMINGTEEPIDWYDAGVSGSTPLAERPAGGSLLAALAPGDTVIAAKLDRLFRSASDALSTAEAFQARGIHLILLDCGAEPVTNGAAKLFFSILAAVAEFEKGRILERMTDGRHGKRRRGGYVGGGDPYGYASTGSGGDAVLIDSPEEQATIRLAAELRLSGGLSLRAIGRRLEEAGHRTRSGKPWEAMQVKRLIEGATP